MIVVIGHASDGVAKRVYQALGHINQSCFWLDADRVGQTFQVNRRGVKGPDGGFSFDEVSSVYNRILNISVHSENMTAWARLLSWLDAQSYVINKPTVVMNNFFKPEQLCLIQQFFQVPKSYIVARRHFSLKNSVIKSISSVVSQTKAYRSMYVPEPVLIQKKLSGYHVRIHVIQDRALACQIQAQAIDYRYCSQSCFSEILLSDDKSKRAIALSEAIGAQFTGIDFIVQDGQWYCLEVNTAPGFTYFDDRLEQNIILKELLVCLMHQ